VEDEALIKEIRKKIGFSSNLTIIEYQSRMKAGKDPYYKKPIIDPPASLISEEELEALREFLPFLIKQRNFLKILIVQ
jgi:hypothetical protein